MQPVVLRNWSSCFYMFQRFPSPSVLTEGPIYMFPNACNNSRYIRALAVSGHFPQARHTQDQLYVPPAYLDGYLELSILRARPVIAKRHPPCIAPSSSRARCTSYVTWTSHHWMTLRNSKHSHMSGDPLHGNSTPCVRASVPRSQTIWQMLFDACAIRPGIGSSGLMTYVSTRRIPQSATSRFCL